MLDPPKPGSLVRLKDPSGVRKLSLDMVFVVLSNDDFLTKGQKAGWKEMVYYVDSPPLLYLNTTFLPERTFLFPKEAHLYSHHNSYWMPRFLFGSKIWVALFPEEEKWEQYFETIQLGNHQ